MTAVDEHGFYDGRYLNAAGNMSMSSLHSAHSMNSSVYAMGYPLSHQVSLPYDLELGEGTSSSAATPNGFAQTPMSAGAAATQANTSRKNRGASKRARVRFTPLQLQILNDTLAKTDYPTTEERQAIAAKLDIPVRRVQVWFQNQRQGRKKGQAKDNVSIASQSINQPSPTTSNGRHKSSSAEPSPGPSVPTRADVYYSAYNGQPQAPLPQRTWSQEKWVSPPPGLASAPFLQQPPTLLQPNPTHAVRTHDWSAWAEPAAMMDESTPDFLGHLVAPSSQIFPLVNNSNSSRHPQSQQTSQSSSHTFQQQHSSASQSSVNSDATPTFQSSLLPAEDSYHYSDTSSVPTLDTHGVTTMSSNTTFSPTQSFDSDMLIQPSNIFPLTPAFSDRIASYRSSHHHTYEPQSDYAPMEVVTSSAPFDSPMVDYATPVAVSQAFSPPSVMTSTSDNMSRSRTPSSFGAASKPPVSPRPFGQPQSIFANQAGQGRPLSDLLTKFRRRGSRQGATTTTTLNGNAPKSANTVTSINLLEAALQASKAAYQPSSSIFHNANMTSSGSFTPAMTATAAYDHSTGQPLPQVPEQQQQQQPQQQSSMTDRSFGGVAPAWDSYLNPPFAPPNTASEMLYRNPSPNPATR